jgi:uncharacterized protein (TIGR03437 family)
MRRGSCLLFCLLFSAGVCVAQSAKVYTIDTVVGGAVYDGLAATATPLNAPNGLWLDRDGALWVADMGNHVIRRMDPVTGAMRVVVGGGTIVEDAVPAPAGSVQLSRPSHLLGDAAGNIYFTDSGNNRVRKLTPDGLVTTVVGTGQAGYAGDGAPARLALLNSPSGLVFDAAGNLYIADAGNCRIRRVDAASNISTMAGSGQCRNSGDGGPALKAGLPTAGFPHGMNGLAFDSKGNLYVAAREAIRRIDRGTGIITTVVGIPNDGPCGQYTDGTLATTRATCGTVGLLFDQDDNLYFTYTSGLAKVTAATGLVTHMGGQWHGGGVVRNTAGRFVFTASLNARVLQTGTAPPQVTTIAGTDDPFDGPGRLAVLTQPSGIATDAQGNVYVAEMTRNRVRRIDAASGQTTTVVGGGTTPLADGVPATAAKADRIRSVHVDSRGNIFFDQIPSVWKVDAATGKISRVAGQGQQGYSGDGGPAVQATLFDLTGIVTDAAGNVFIADAGNYRVRKVDAATGIITTIAGNGSSAAPSGDGGPATAASLPSLSGLAFDRSGQLLIGAQDLRRVDLSTGLIATVQARSQPGGPLGKVGGAAAVTVDRENNIFFLSGNSIVKIQAADSLLATVAGSSIPGFFGDGGLASLARFSLGQSGITADPAGNIYVADSENGRVRKLSPTIVKPEMAVSPTTLFFTQLQGSTILTGQPLSISSANNLLFDWTLEISTSAGGNWLYASKTSGAAPATILLTVDASKLGAGSYRGTVTVKSAATSNPSQTVEVVLTVTGTAGAALGLSQQYLNFQAVAGGSNPAAQTLSITNAGSGTLSWSATAETSSGGQWLRISSGLGTAPSSLVISADITGLAQGVYQGQVTLRNLTASETKIISVVLTVSKTQPILLPTQTGFLFVGIEGSLVIGPQSFAIQNAGQGRMDWQIQVNLPAGGDWLRVSPTSGTSDAAVQAAPTVTLLVDPSKLRAGVSVGLLTITASGALNAPQTAIVLVNMLARGSLPVGTINPLGVIFTAASGASGALTQGISIASTGGQALQYLARTQTQAGGSWLSVTPEQGVLLSSAETAGLSVQAQPTGLSAGVYVGSVILSFGTGVTQEVAVALVVSPVATSSSVPGTVAHRPWTLDLGPGTSAAACAPRRMVIVETKLGNRFSLQSGWPIPMLVQAVDDCGSAVSSATVAAGFTGNEPPLVFQNLRNGNYAATWVPATKGSIGVTVRAVASGLEDGVFQFSGTLGEASKLPLVFRDGWVNAASFDRYKPLAPGMIFSLFGSNLAEGKNLASQIPLPRTLGNIKATIGGYEAPLFYADSGQVNAQVPFELTPGVATLVVTGKDAAGAPGTVTIVNAQPGVFTVSQSGTGQGVVLDGLNNLVDSSHAVKAGEAVVIYATGLGATSPAVATGQAAPAVPPLALVTTPVKVTIGGVEAAVEFAGLAPGFVGLYQVNARVPAGVTAGNAVALVLTQNGVASNTVTIAVK